MFQVAEAEPQPTAAPAELATIYQTLSQLDRIGSDVQLIDQIALLEKIKHRCEAQQATLTHTLATEHLAAAAARNHDLVRARRSINGQIALARRMSPHRAARLVRTAQCLITDLPHVQAALDAGDTTEFRVGQIVQQWACLTPADRRRADVLIAAELPTLGDRSADTVAARIAGKLDPEAVLAKIRGAVKDRCVSTRPAPDTMGRLSALLTIPQIVAVRAALEQIANAAKAIGDPRSRGQIMADTLYSKITEHQISGCDDYGIPIPAELDFTTTDADIAAYENDKSDGPNEGDADITAYENDKNDGPNEGDADRHEGGLEDDEPEVDELADDDVEEETVDDVEITVDLDTDGQPGDDTADDEPDAEVTVDVDADGEPHDNTADHDPDADSSNVAAEGDAGDATGGHHRDAESIVEGDADGEPKDDSIVDDGADGKPGEDTADQNLDAEITVDPHAEQEDDTADDRDTTNILGLDRKRPPGRRFSHQSAQQHQPPPPAVHINLVMTDRTLLGHDQEPAHLTGYGWIPAAYARHLIRHHTDPRTTTWIRRLYTDPTGNQILHADARQRLFPRSIRDVVIARDQICRTPWCDAPIRHTDHITPYADGGPTDLANAQGLCENCNYTKNEPGWTSRSEPDGAIITTTPTGHRYSSSPPTPPRARSFRADFVDFETRFGHPIYWAA